MDYVILLGSISCSILLVIFFFQLHARIKGAPLVRSKETTLTKAATMLNLQPGEIVYDLGCGDGTVLFFFEKHMQTSGIGIDQSSLLTLWNTFRALLGKSTVQFIRADLTSWAPTTPGKYYLFMMPKLFPHMNHIFDAMPMGTLVLCNTFPITRTDFTLVEKHPDDGFQKGEWLFLFEKKGESQRKSP